MDFEEKIEGLWTGYQAIDMKMIFFILMQMILISTRKIVHIASFWKWEVLELGK